MRALVYTAPKTVEMQQRSRPELAPGEAEIAIEKAGICGSDISAFLGHSARRRPGLVLGHELIGSLEDGRRVVANPLISCGSCWACLSGSQNQCESWRLLGMDQTPGAFAEFVAVPESQIYEIPASLPSSRAILTEPLANVVHLFRLAAPPPLFRLAVVGAGTMGALAVSFAKLIGARDILVVDVNDQRLESMAQLGAAAVVNTGSAEGRAKATALADTGFDVVLDASGSAAARQMAFDLCQPGGQVVLLGMGAQKSEVDFVTSIRKEHRVTMSFAYNPVDFERSLSLLIAGEIDLSQWTLEMPLEEGQQAFDIISGSPGATLKALLTVSAH
jgi:2-desacetyl-2-hydroxyethyl bacteriochlorophyllide A dehydrogenase